jgi:hypothetical protein
MTYIPCAKRATIYCSVSATKRHCLCRESAGHDLPHRCAWCGVTFFLAQPSVLEGAVRDG